MLFFLFIQSVWAIACNDEFVRYDFTPCNLNNTKTALFYWNETCQEGNLPNPIDNLSCNFECQPGSYLDVDASRKQLQCKNCPSGTYNKGGSLRFGNYGISWTDLSSYFKSYCWTSERINWIIGKNCTEWEVKNDTLSSGSTVEDVWYMVQLDIPARLVKPGNLTVNYSKETRTYQDKPNGEFVIIVDESEAWYDTVSNLDKDMMINIPLTSGSHIIKLVYLKFNAKNMTDLGIAFKRIEISGVYYSSNVCYRCDKGYSSPGSSECSICNADQYWSDSDVKCMDCPNNTYSLPGSISAQDCKPRSACTQQDYKVLLTSCSAGKRQKSYQWNVPYICDAERGVKLPDDAEIDCKVCESGYYYSLNSSEVECLSCSSGYISYGEESCFPCPAGQSSNENHSSCIDCPGILFSESPGSTCKECPQHTRLNAKSTACVSLRYVSFENSTYYIYNMTGIHENGTQDIPEVCSRSSYKLYCYNTFYGPIEGSSKIFYLSVLNPSLLSFSQYPSIDSLTYGYAYAILKQSDLKYSPKSINITTSNCKNSDDVLVNLGSYVGEIHDNNDGMTVLYKDGSMSDPDLDTKFSSSIQFICDKEQEIGWPELTNFNSSHFSFVWKNRFGCPICKPEDLPTFTGWCDNGYREFSMFESKDCIFVGNRYVMNWRELCNATTEIIKTWPVILGFAAFFVVSGLTLLITLCFCKTRGKYRRLMQSRALSLST